MSAIVIQLRALIPTVTNELPAARRRPYRGDLAGVEKGGSTWPGKFTVEQLRHGGVAVTARHYVESRSRSVLGFGHLLKGERTIISIDEAKGDSPERKLG